eukprot:796902-Rhodomonas_salina.1
MQPRSLHNFVSTLVVSDATVQKENKSIGIAGTNCTENVVSCASFRTAVCASNRARAPAVFSQHNLKSSARLQLS